MKSEITNMSTKRKTNSAAEKTEVGLPKTTDEMILAFIALLADEQVVNKLRKALFPTCLPIKFGLTAKISTLTDRLEKRDAHRNELEKRLTTVETNYDQVEHYSRRSNLRFHGIDETENDDTTTKVIAIVNDTMKVAPPIDIGDIVTSNPLGHKQCQRLASTRRPTRLVRKRADSSAKLLARLSDNLTGG